MGETWPLIGRTEELRRIASAIRKTGPASGIVITGPAGVGKTRLVREALTATTRPSQWVAATKTAQAIPLGALITWVPDDATASASVVDTVTAGLLGDEGGRRMVVAVDDAHLLDDQSAFVLQQVLAGGLASVILTVRDGDPVPETVESLSVGLERVELRQLSRHEFTLLLETRLGGPINPVMVSRLWDLTRGNALYARHLVDHAVQRNQVERRDGVWTLASQFSIPSTLYELIIDRLHDLPARVADVVDLLAAGEPLCPATLVDLVGEDAVAHAQAHGLVSEESEPGGDAQLRLIHPMYGEVLRAATGQLRLRHLRSRVASSMGRTAPTDARTVLRRAVLLLDSDAPDAAEMLRAADIALWLFDPELATRFAHAAVNTGGGWRATLTQARCLIYAGHNDQADLLFSDIASKDLPAAARAHVAFLRVWNLQTSGRVDAAAAMLTATRPTYVDDPAPSAFMALESLAAACGGRPTDAVAGADAALACAELPPSAAFLALQAKAIAAGDLGRSEGLNGLEDEAERRCGSIAAGSMRMSFADIYAYSLRLVGRLVEAHDVIARVADGVDTPIGLSWVELMTAATELSDGKAHAAAQRFRNIGLSRDGHPDQMGWLFRSRIAFVQACSISGDVDTAQRMLALINANPHRTFDFLTPQRLLADAWVRASQGWLSGAVEAARCGAERANRNGQHSHEVVCLQTATRFGDTNTAFRLAALTKLVTGPRITVAAEHAAALAVDDGTRLDSAADDFYAMGDRLSAADATAQAAAAHSRADRRGSALSSANRARQLADECGPVNTPALVALGAPAKFTSRQLEIVGMAAHGLTNRRIAELLAISIRTVECHLYLACQIVGVADRSELAAALRRRSSGGIPS